MDVDERAAARPGSRVDPAGGGGQVARVRPAWRPLVVRTERDVLARPAQKFELASPPRRQARSGALHVGGASGGGEENRGIEPEVAPQIADRVVLCAANVQSAGEVADQAVDAPTERGHEPLQSSIRPSRSRRGHARSRRLSLRGLFALGLSSPGLRLCRSAELTRPPCVPAQQGDAGHRCEGRAGLQRHRRAPGAPQAPGQQARGKRRDADDEVVRAVCPASRGPRRRDPSRAPSRPAR